MSDIFTKEQLAEKISQVLKEIPGMASQTCGVDMSDYEIGAKEVLERLKDITGINQY